MSKRPYEDATKEWLSDTESLLRSILLAAGHHRQNLQHLADDRKSNPQSLLDFAGIEGRDVAIAMQVCDRLMEALGPTAQAMRDELNEREAQAARKPRGNRLLPILKN